MPEEPKPFLPDRTEFILVSIGLVIFSWVYLTLTGTIGTATATDSRSPEVQAMDYAYLKGKRDGYEGRRLTEGQMQDLNWTADQRRHYRGGADWGKYDAAGK